MLRILMLSCLSLAYANESEILGRQVTELARRIIVNIKSSGNDVLNPPDLPPKEWNNHSLDNKGVLFCKFGWVKSLTTLQRNGSADMWKDGDKYIIRVPLEFGNLSIGFDVCNVIRGGNYTTKIEGERINNSVDLQIILTGKDSTCVATVDYVELYRAETFKVKSENEKLQKIWPLVDRWIMVLFYQNIPKKIDEALGNAVNSSLQEVDLCSTIPNE